MVTININQDHIQEIRGSMEKNTPPVLTQTMHEDIIT